VGRSNNINSFVLYMLLIQYLQFVVLFTGGRWQFDFAVFLRLLYTFVIYIAAYSGYLYFQNFFGTIFIR